MRVPAPLRALGATTADQDANRARAQLHAFAADRGFPAFTVKNERGAKLAPG